MKSSGWLELLFAAILVFLAIFVPFFINGYWLSIGVTSMMYIALSTSWALFSGPTHYISLATGAFYGVGGYLVGAGMSDYQLSFWLMLAISPIVAALLAFLIGIATFAIVRRLFCHLHPWFSRDDPQPCVMDPKQFSGITWFVRFHRFSRSTYLLDAASCGCCGLFIWLGHKPFTDRVCA